jgi:hypothetical protein
VEEVRGESPLRRLHRRVHKSHNRAWQNCQDKDTAEILDPRWVHDAGTLLPRIACQAGHCPHQGHLWQVGENALYGEGEVRDECPLRMRHSPSDPRFPEFYELTEFEQKTCTKSSSNTIGVKGDASWEDFQALQLADNKGCEKMVFARGSEQEDTDVLPLCEFPSDAKNKRALPNEGLRASSSKQQLSMGGSASGSVSSQILSHMENSKTLLAQGQGMEGQAGEQKTNQAIIKVTSCLYTAKGLLLQKSAEDRKFENKVKGPLLDIENMIKALDKCKEKKKKAVSFAVVQEAAKLVKKYWRLIEDM